MSLQDDIFDVANKVIGTDVEMAFERICQHINDYDLLEDRLKAWERVGIDLSRLIEQTKRENNIE